jgi:hypothetical protein
VIDWRSPEEGLAERDEQLRRRTVPGRRRSLAASRLRLPEARAAGRARR